MELPKLKLNTMTKEQFFGKLFQIRNQIHLFHLSTKSYSAHIASNEFYDKLLDLTDSLIESYQGKQGVLENITIPEAKKEDAITIIKSLVSLTDDGVAYNSLFNGHTYLQNQLDEISSLCYSALYKLQNLK